jgi:peptidoglycan hydrolase CwlO-like protein
MTSRTTAPTCLALAVVAGALALTLAAPPAGRAEPGVDELRSQAGSRLARERSLSADVARLDALMARLQRQLDILERRRAQVQAELDADRARLATLQARLRGERARLVRLRARLAEARRTLAERLVAVYQTPTEDVVSVVLDAHSFTDLLDRGEFLRLIEAQDRRIIVAVRRARAATTAAIARLAVDQARMRNVVVAVTARRNALVSMAQALAQRRAALGRARGVRAAALRATRAERLSLEARIRKLEQATAATRSGPGGPWAIPWPIVQCESGGQNVPPNWAGASGYYQIIPSTWRLYGGTGAAAYLASRAEQDRVAARIWAGSGPGAWDCAAIVGR